MLNILKLYSLTLFTEYLAWKVWLEVAISNIWIQELVYRENNFKSYIYLPWRNWILIIRCTFFLKHFCYPSNLFGIRENGETSPPPKKKYNNNKTKIKNNKNKFNIRYESDAHIYIYNTLFYVRVYFSGDYRGKGNRILCIEWS